MGLPEWPEMAIAPQNRRDQGMMGGPPERPEMAIATLECGGGATRAAGHGDRDPRMWGEGYPLELGVGWVFDINSS